METTRQIETKQVMMSGTANYLTIAMRSLTLAARPNIHVRRVQSVQTQSKVLEGNIYTTTSL